MMSLEKGCLTRLGLHAYGGHLDVSVVGMRPLPENQPWGTDMRSTCSTGWVQAEDEDTFPPHRCSLGGAEPGSERCNRYLP